MTLDSVSEKCQRQLEPLLGSSYPACGCLAFEQTIFVDRHSKVEKIRVLQIFQQHCYHIVSQ